MEKTEWLNKVHIFSPSFSISAHKLHPKRYVQLNSPQIDRTTDYFKGRRPQFTYVKLVASITPGVIAYKLRFGTGGRLDLVAVHQSTKSAGLIKRQGEQHRSYHTFLCLCQCSNLESVWESAGMNTNNLKCHFEEKYVRKLVNAG